jgi:hypothetical protein
MKTPITIIDGDDACLPAVSAAPTSCMAHSHGGRADCALLKNAKVTPYFFLILSLTKGPLHLYVRLGTLFLINGFSLCLANEIKKST